MRYIKEFFLDYTSPYPKVILECGAHHGLTTILLSRWVPNGRIIAFEALPNNVDILRKNLELNGCSNVTAVGKAVGKDGGTIRVRNRSNSAIDRKGAIVIESTSIDRYCKDESIIPDVIKIDVEGFEIDVLEGARNILSKSPAIFIEIHSELLYRYGRRVDEIWNFLDKSKYEIWIQPDDRRPPLRFTGQEINTRVHLFFRPLNLASNGPIIAMPRPISD